MISDPALTSSLPYQSFSMHLLGQCSVTSEMLSLGWFLQVVGICFGVLWSSNDVIPVLACRVILWL